LEYVANLLTQLSIYVIAVAALDVLLGYAGIASLGHAAFIGIGAYTAAILATTLHLGFPVALLSSVAVTSLLALAVGIPTLRLSGDYFVLGTFGLATVTSSVMQNWVDVTNGPFGIYGIPVLSLFGMRLSTPIAFLGLPVATMALTLIVKQLLVKSPFGVTLRAIRADELVAAVSGKNVTRMRVMAFMIAGAGAGIAGVLQAYDLRFIDPTLFTVQLTIFVWAALYVGGCASWIGNILGPLLLFGLPEALRFVGLAGTSVAEIREILYGALLIGITIYRPQGIAGTYRVR
jgi:branched-chain amino acid transport system permease protein